MNPKITFVCCVRNEELTLPGLVRNVRPWVDEILILDGQSTDRTRAVAKKLGARVIVRQEARLTSEYPLNHYLTLAKNDWILNIDADERLTPALARRLRALVRDPKAKAFLFPRKNFFRPGHWMRHGGLYPDWQMCLYHRRAIRFSRLLHGMPAVRGGVRKVDLPILHLKYLRSSSRARQQTAEWALGESEVVSNPAIRLLWFVPLLAYFTITLFILQLGFLEPGFFRLFVWESARHYSRYPGRFHRALKAVVPFFP